MGENWCGGWGWGLVAGEIESWKKIVIKRYF